MEQVRGLFGMVLDVLICVVELPSWRKLRAGLWSGITEL